MTREIDEVLSGARRWCVVTGDCLDVLPTIERVDHLITDGPYGVGGAPETRDDGPYVAALRFFAGCPSRSFFGYAETIVDWIIRLGWGPPSSWVTWCPSNAEAKAGARHAGRLARLSEHVAIYGSTHGARHVRRERARSGKAIVGRSGDDRGATAQAGDVWTDASPGIGFNSSSRLHPNEKPVDIMLRLVKLVSDADALVIDPFCGSGTTGVAALRLGRRFIGIEKEERWAALSRERLTAEERGSTLQAQRAGQETLFR